jgi:hypothetical protein
MHWVYVDEPIAHVHMFDDQVESVLRMRDKLGRKVAMGSGINMRYCRNVSASGSGVVEPVLFEGLGTGLGVDGVGAEVGKG